MEENNFEKLTQQEKVIVLMYKKKLEQNTPINEIMELLKKVNKIHEKHQNFCMYDVP
jgi:hypothetical protein